MQRKAKATAAIGVSHSTDEIAHWGVEQARKGGVSSDRVLNALSLQQIARHFAKRRRVHARAA